MRPDTLLRYAFALAFVLAGTGWLTTAAAQVERTATETAALDGAANRVLPTLTLGTLARSGADPDSVYYDDGDNTADSFAGITDPETPYNTSMQFTATGQLTVTAAAAIFRTETEADETITFELWDGDGTSGDPTSGTLLTSETITVNVTDGAYVRVPFDSSFDFEADDEFYVVIRYPTSIIFPQGFDDRQRRGPEPVQHDGRAR